MKRTMFPMAMIGGFAPPWNPMPPSVRHWQHSDARMAAAVAKRARKDGIRLYNAMMSAAMNPTISAERSRAMVEVPK